MLGPVQLRRIRLALTTVDIRPKGLATKYVVLCPAKVSLPGGRSARVLCARPKYRARMVDSLSKIILLKCEEREVLDSVEEDVELPRAIDDIGALKPFLRQNPL